ncbi:MAG: transcription repressor NadR [Treponema sp.]|nr:transcription repressor NadR [Treponema sp.]
MDGDSRRKQVLYEITHEEPPISATSLAKKLSVSRQVIVGDVALLRAQGHEIIATARGYTMPQNLKEGYQYTGKVACLHSAENSETELYTIVDCGAAVVNVIIEHELYGEITGNLNLKSRKDVDTFTSKLKESEAKLLSELTQGVHLHTIACRDKKHFEEITQELEANGIIFHN